MAEIRRCLARIKNFRFYKILFYIYSFVQYNAENSGIFQKVQTGVLSLYKSIVFARLYWRFIEIQVFNLLHTHIYN